MKLFQLWHAVGAFKTFGFSRLGKFGAANQDSPNHRSYDYAIVSSKKYKKIL
ncbi:CDP-glycerol glycerophosphotransferase family protein [Methanobrevibacter arboriphilus]|uniref:CDP-glycerol glycerophosphotransferase family protein n=1 Tax=Methanobrevibacter arboriphilus TaxID=39441 RepID=UPI00373FD4F3